MQVKIFGAGLSGLIAASMLRRFDPVIYESQPSLPNNHLALLRFRSNEVSKATAIPFKQVQVTKGIAYKGEIHNRPSPQFNNMYSHKVTGKVMDRSIGDLMPVLRYIAPSNFIQQLSRGAKIEYNSRIEDHAIDARSPNSDPIISTVPMPTLMACADFAGVRPKFTHRPIHVIQVEIERPETNVYQTLYYPDPDVAIYRASLTGKVLTIELTEMPTSASDIVVDVLHNFGFPSNCKALITKTKTQEYGKIVPINEESRRAFILKMTDDYRIYSLGRFATWRQILMDDVVKDVALIDRWISARSRYEERV